jgi:sterol desaturase/sphingolipid hydroxylase (fatty acid hydroxylase superfamily)
MAADNYILENEAVIRLSLFAGVFLLIALWELLAPKRALHYSKFQRWSTNWGFVVFNTLLVRLLFPIAAVGVAAYAQEHSIGLFNITAIYTPIAAFSAIILLDLIIYWQHRFFHLVPVLWRVHQVHHADVDYDVSLGSRFHPLEIGLSMLIKFAAILVLGVPVVAVVIFEVLLNALAMFNHGNIRLPARLDGWIRQLIVTPDMHRVHHSTISKEFNSNFGFQLSVWDRWFGSYQAQPSKGHQDMDIGLPYVQPPQKGMQWLSMLVMPFKR